MTDPKTLLGFPVVYVDDPPVEIDTPIELGDFGDYIVKMTLTDYLRWRIARWGDYSFEPQHIKLDPLLMRALRDENHIPSCVQPEETPSAFCGIPIIELTDAQPGTIIIE